MPHGTRFARGVAPHRDTAGHSLPSENSLKAVFLTYLCGSCWDRWRRRITLIQFRAPTTAPAYTPDLLEELASGRAVTERNKIRETDGRIRYQFKFRCPRCGSEPCLNEDRVQERMAAEYEPGCQERTVDIPLS